MGTIGCVELEDPTEKLKPVAISKDMLFKEIVGVLLTINILGGGGNVCDCWMNCKGEVLGWGGKAI